MFHLNRIFLVFLASMLVQYNALAKEAATDRKESDATAAATAFTAPTDDGDKAEVVAPSPALDLGSFPIPYSNGQITFLDETPDEETPTISIVVVEDAGANTLADLARQGAMTPLETFLYFALPDTPIPPRLQLDYDLRFSGDPRNQVGGKLVFPTVMHGSLPTVDDDDWGDGCQSWAGWKNGFDSWVGNFLIPRDHVNVEIGSNDKPNTWYGYLGRNDKIWVGVCMTSGDIIRVKMQVKDSFGNWQPVGGNTLPTDKLLDPGQRYLYYNYKMYSQERRVRVSSIGSAQYTGGNWVFISGAWTDNSIEDNEAGLPPQNDIPD